MRSSAGIPCREGHPSIHSASGLARLPEDHCAPSCSLASIEFAIQRVLPRCFLRGPDADATGPQLLQHEGQPLQATSAAQLRRALAPPPITRQADIKALEDRPPATPRQPRHRQTDTHKPRATPAPWVRRHRVTPMSVRLLARASQMDHKQCNRSNNIPTEEVPHPARASSPSFPFRAARHPITQNINPTCKATIVSAHARLMDTRLEATSPRRHQK